MQLRPLTVTPPAARPAATAAAPLDKRNYTPLQKHIDYFDGNQDGKVSMGETRQGLKDLGAGGILAFVGGLFINGLLGPKTAGKLTTVIAVADIHKGKHDSDTDVFDDKGNVDPKAFDAMFAQYDTDKSDTMDAEELVAMRTARAETKLGKIAGAAEFNLLLKFAADGKKVVNGKEIASISRPRLVELYAGTLFQKIAAERKAAGK